MQRTSRCGHVWSPMFNFRSPSLKMVLSRPSGPPITKVIYLRFSLIQSWKSCAKERLEKAFPDLSRATTKAPRGMALDSSSASRAINVLGLSALRSSTSCRVTGHFIRRRYSSHSIRSGLDFNRPTAVIVMFTSGHFIYVVKLFWFHFSLKQRDVVEVRDCPKIYQGHKMSEIPV